MDLQQYDRLKTALGEILRSATMRMSREDQENVRDLFGRLAEDRFNLVVVGRFSRGKTSLMNAMLGTNRLPTGIVPVTSVITTVTYGTEELVTLYYQHTSLFFEIPISELADHITERGNPGNARGIRNAEVQLPAELLRRGFHFIDTPGLGSSIIENTRTTEAFLPEADAFILVTSYDSPLSEEEQRVVQAVHAWGRPIFIAVNKQDTADISQRQQVLDHLSSQLSAIFGNALPPVFSLSAQQALEARLHGSTAKLTDTGLPAFEEALFSFLFKEKRQKFLANMCDRIAAVLPTGGTSEQELARLRAVRSEIVADQGNAAAAVLLTQGPAISPTLPACEVCGQVADAIFDFLAEYQYQLHGNREVQSDLAKRHGLCGPHTRQFEAIAAPQQVCTGFADVAARQAVALAEAARRGLAGQSASQAVEILLPTAQTCPACEVVRRATRNAVAMVAARLLREKAAGVRTLSAICLPHLQLLVAALPNSDLVRAVLERHASLLDRLSEDMRHFALKRDSRQRYLITKEERDAGERTLRVLVGDPRAQLDATSLREMAGSGQ